MTVSGNPATPPTPPADPPSGPPADPPQPPKPSDIPPKPQSESGPTKEDVDKLQQALDRERNLRKDAEKRAKEGDGYKSKLDEIEEAAKSEQEKAIAAAVKEATAEAMTAANWRIVNAEARALAAQAGFRDPADAVRLITLDDVNVTQDGSADAERITAALTTLAADKPYLLSSYDATPRTPRPDPSQGSGKPAQLTGEQQGLAEAERRFGKRTE